MPAGRSVGLSVVSCRVVSERAVRCVLAAGEGFCIYFFSLFGLYISRLVGRRRLRYKVH